MSRMRPELPPAGPSSATTLTNGTAYLVIYSAVQQQGGLVHGKLHSHGAHCAIGSFYAVNKGVTLYETMVDEVAAVNDSVPHLSNPKRKAYVARWLRWRLKTLGMPGFGAAKQP